MTVQSLFESGYDAASRVLIVAISRRAPSIVRPGAIRPMTESMCALRSAMSSGGTVERRPELRLCAHVRRQDADDRERRAVERDRLADERGIAGEATQPRSRTRE